MSELTPRSTTLPLSSSTGSSIEQRGYKKVHWKERVLNTLVESSRLVPVMSVLSLERNGTSVAFTCSGDCDSSRQPRPLLQSSRVSLLTDQMRSGTHWVQANLTSHGRLQVVCGQVGCSFPFTDHNSARGWSFVVNRRGRTSYRLHRGRQDIEGVRVR